MEWYLTTALVLVALGVALLAAEFFLPTGGVLVVGGLALFAVAVGVVVLYGDTTEAAVSVIALCVGVPVLWAGSFSVWQRMAMRIGLDSETLAATVADAPAVADLARLAGRYGRTLTPMRPSGSVEIDGRRVDAQTEGLPLDAGTWVKCVAVRAGRVVVRRADAGGDLADLPLDELK